jgi:tyrosine decarboxylase/aspartate 1-decarboxylase
MAMKETGEVFPYEKWMRQEDQPPPTSFPEKGLTEEEALRLVQSRLSEDTPPKRNLYIFGLEGHPFSKKIFSMAADSYQVGFAKDIYPGTYRMAQECVRMIGSLLGAPNAAGMLTTGGTESNLSSVRLARNIGKKRKPELVMPLTGHYSFHLAAELFGLRVRVAKVNSDFSPKMEDVKRLINKNTVMLACTAPEPMLGVIDPVEEFGELAKEHDLYLHVDAAVGGFILPFMRELGYRIPPFDFKVPQVVSMTADPHKLAMQQKPTSSFIIRDRSYLKAIPVERVFIPALSASGRPGASAVSLWALFHHLGKEGYKKCVKNSMDLTKLVAEEIQRINGLELLMDPIISIVTFKSDKYDLAKINEKMEKRGWVLGGVATHFVTGTRYMRVFIHPLKQRSTIDEFLENLRAAVNETKHT